MMKLVSFASRAAPLPPARPQTFRVSRTGSGTGTASPLSRACCSYCVPLSKRNRSLNCSLNAAFPPQVVLALALAAASAGVIQHPGLGLTYGAAPLVHGAVPLVQPAPLTYTVGAAPALVNPAPYRVHTGVKTVVAAEPVEQHGYVIKY